MSVVSLAAQLIVAQQQHEPPAGAHYVVLAGAVVAGLAILGVRWWRGRRDARDADEQSPSYDRPARSTTEEEQD
jgi:hypothetical protein